MKKILKLGICVLLSTIAITCCAQTVTDPAKYNIVHRQANERTWQRTEYDVLPSGQTIPHVQTIEELGSGLCYLGPNGQWLDSQEVINLMPDGSAAATNGQSQVFFPIDAATGTVRLITPAPEFLVMESRPISISYSDGTNLVVVASITNSIGELVASNEVLYPSVLVGPGVKCDVLYEYRKSGLEQDVIFRSQPPAPEQVGLDSAYSKLQIMTEFFNPPTPGETAEPVNAQSGLADTTLSFGSMKMIQGRAFLTGDSNDGRIPTFKSWVPIDSTNVALIEQVPYSQISASLATLPRVAARMRARPVRAPALQAGNIRPPQGRRSVTGGKTAAYLQAPGYVAPSRRGPVKGTHPLRMSKANIGAGRGFCMDYIAISGDVTNVVFAGDSDYYISSPCYLYGETMIEGGVLVQMNTNGELVVEPNGTVDCETGPYLPGLFTSVNDNIFDNSLGSGSPAMGDVNTFLDFQSTNVALHDLHFSYALSAVRQTTPGDSGSVNLRDCEFMDVDTAVDAFNIGLYNVLIGRNAITNAAVILEGTNLVAENVTADYGSACFQAATSGATVALTNCLITSQSLLTADSSSANLETNAVVCLDPPSAPVFQVTGCGNYYLTNGSPYATAATANIDAHLLADLQQKTVWPPMVYADTNVSSLGTLRPAARDTNCAAIGFHYSPLDYVFGGVDFYSNLTVTAGTAIGWFEEVGHVNVAGQPYSITLNNGANLSLNGSATRPCYWSQFAMIQERGNNNWDDYSGFMGSMTFNGNNSSQEPLLYADFTKFTAGFLRGLFRDDSDLGAAGFKNCELYNEAMSTYDMQYLTYTNCLFFRDMTFTYNNSALNFTNENCTYYNGALALARLTGQNSFWSVENTIFDGTLLAFYDDYSGATNYTFFEYNAFNTNNPSWETYGFPYNDWTMTNTLEDLGSSDLLTTNYDWTQSWFGNFYVSTNQAVVGKGSTNANFLGLYHFTTRTDQTPEGTNIVTIGYHYVATDTNGLPLDSNGDGIPDYLEDANGNGLVDGGETNWALAILVQPISQIAVVGTNADFYVGADGVEPLSYQWYFNGTNIAWATNAMLTLTNVQSTNEGLYFAVVTNFAGSLTSSVVALEPSGLIGWWPSEGNALDDAGPNNGNLTNGVSFSNGIIGQDFQFDGTNGYILVPDSPILKPTNLTIESWVRFSSLTSKKYGSPPADLAVIVEKPDINEPGNTFYNDGYILFKQKNGSHDNFEFGVTASDGETEIFAKDSTLSIQTNVWYLVAGVRGSNYIELYVNGQLSDHEGVDFDQSYGTAPLYFASLGETDDERVKGNLDELALYNRALSSNEVQETYSAELAGIRNCFVPPVIVTQPSSQWVTEGTTATLLVAAAGSPPMSYQWSFDGTNIAGATNATLILPGVQGTNTGNYSVVVSNDQGTVASSNAFLTVQSCFSSVDVAMVIDDSGSMGDPLGDGNIKLLAAQIAGTNFVQGLNFTSDQAALFSFNNSVTINQTLTNDISDLLNGIGSLTNASGCTFMGNALQIAQEELAGPRHNPDAMPVMVFMSDGQPTDIELGNDFVDTSNLVLGAATLVKASGTRLITVALGTDADTNFMALMATSPSDTYYATNVSQLTNVYNLIAASICRGTNTPTTNTLSVQITYPFNDQIFNVGSNILVTAVATNSPYAAPVYYVEFFDGTNALGFEANTNAFTNTLYQTYWLPLNAGTHVLKAFAMATNAVGAWSSWSQSVTNVINGLPTVAITNPVSGANLGSMYANTEISASIVPAGAAITNVTYYLNGFPIGSNASLPYQIPSPSLAAGVYTLYAMATDTNGATGISPNVFVTVEPSNQPPFVYAGPNQITNLPSVQLNGFVSDDGLPTNYLAVWWSLLSGPTGGTVIFGNSNLPVTTATFNMTGTNILQLNATDGQYTNTSQAQIIVLETNLPPVVSAPPIQMAFWPKPNSLMTNASPWISAQWVPYSVSSAIEDEVQFGLTILGYNAQSNCLMKTAVEDTGYQDGNGDEICQYDCLYFDNNLNLTYNLGSYGLGPLGGWSPPFASVENTNGGFNVGDNVFSTAEGVIMRARPDGETIGDESYTDMTGTIQSNAWAVVGPESSAPFDGGYFESLWVDQTGAWGGDLIGLCYDGNIWRINSSGQATWVAYLPGGNWEGAAMTVVPGNVPQYGPWAGRILVDDRFFGDSHFIYAIDTNGFEVDYRFPGSGVSLVGGPVPLNENLLVDQGGQFEAIPASWLNGVAGDILLAGYPFAVLQRVHWNGTAFDVHQPGAVFEDSSEINYLHFAFCPLGATNVPDTEFRLQACVSDDGRLFSPTSNLWTEISGPGSVTFEDPTLTNTLAQFSARGTYVLRFSACDGQFTSLTNVQVNVLYNAAPTVNAGTNQIVPGTNATLNCLVQDDGYPSNQMLVTWSVIAAPNGGTANLDWTNEIINSNNESLTDPVTFTLPGTYTFEVMANDGMSSGSAEVTVTVQSSCLTLSPSFGWPTLTNTPFTVIATLLASNSVPVTNATIEFTVSDLSAENIYTTWSTNTDSNGNASLTYTSASQRGDLITAQVAGQSYEASIQKDWALEIGCDSILQGGNWTCTSISVPPVTISGGWPAPYNADYYVFQATANSTATLSVSNEVDFNEAGEDGVNFAVRDPSNNVVALCDNEMESAGSGYCQLTFPVTLSGNYLVELIALDEYYGDGGGQPYNLALSCNDGTNVYVGAVPQMQLLFDGTNITSGGTIVFPPTVPFVPTNISLTISNSGTGPLTVDEIDTNSQRGAEFIISNNYSGATIPPGSSSSFNVFFEPSTNGIFLGQLKFYGNMVNVGSYMAYLSGNGFGTSAPPSVVITSPENFSTFYAPAIVPLTAQVRPGMTNVASVVFEQLTTNGMIPIGSGSLIGTNQWGYTWLDAVSGKYTIAALATDAAGGTRTSPPIYITVNRMVLTNLPPVMTNASFNVQINSVNNTLNPLADDYDPNGDSLTIVGFSPPENGTASIIDNGQAISYTPKPGYYSESVDDQLQPFDEFNYQVSDGRGGSAQGLVTVYVYPQNPPAVTITNNPVEPQYDAGSTISFTATITNTSPTNIAKVDFYIDTEFIGEVTNATDGSFTLNWTNIFIGGGHEAITAIATDMLGEQGESSPIYVNVTTPSAALIGALNKVTGSYGDTSLAPGFNGALPVVRDGVFQVWGQATNTSPGTSVTWSLGVYSFDGSTPLRDLTPTSTSSVGTAGNPGLLVNNCDLTTLQNGVYEFRLIVIGGGQVQEVDQDFILESNLKIGSFSFSQQDLVIPVNGIPLTVTRTYNSLNPDRGDFGYGWTYTLSDMDVTLDETRTEEQDFNGHTFSVRSGGGRDITLTLPNGQRTTFYYNPRYSPDSIQYYPVWQTAPGMPSSLGIVPSGDYAQVEDFWGAIVESDGGAPYWEDDANASDVPDEVYDFPSFTVTTPDGTRYVLDRQNLGKHTMSGGASGDGYIDQAWGTPYLAEIIELNSNTITINSNSITVASPTGAQINQITFQRNSLGLISSISDPNGIASNGPPAMKYEYDANGNLLNVLRLTDRSGVGTYVTNTFTYTNADFPHYITGVINADGTQIAKTVYNDSGQIVEIDDAYGNKTLEVHNPTNHTETVTDPLNHSTTSVYDTLGNVIAQTNALGEVTTMIYDPNNNKTNTVTYLLNGQPYATNSAVYNGNNNLLSSVDPLGHTNGFTYDGYGEVLSSSDSLGNTTSNSYDGFGNLISTSDALSNTTVNTYGYGGVVSSTDPIKTLTTNIYDPVELDLIASATLDVSGAILSSNTYTYDADNNRLTSTVWRRVNGNWAPANTTNVYDGQNRLTQTINPDGGASSIVYNVDGQQAETIDGLGNVTSNSYDALGHLVQTTYPDGTTTSFAYDAAGNRTNSVDQLGRTTTYVYDDLNRLVETIYPDGTTNATVYDDLGRVVETIDARGTITANDYDVAGRRIAVINASGIASVENTNSYSYDADGNQIVFTDANGHSTTNVYDALDRQIQVQYPDGTATETVYDGDGRSVAQTNQDGIATLFGYDGSGRLTSVTNALGQVTQYQYDQAGNETAQIDALLRTNTYFYDGMGRRIAHIMPGGQREGFAYDLDGNQVYHTNFDGTVVTNLYDADNRLTNVSSVFGYYVSFAYSATGQRTNMIDASGQTVYTYDSRDRLLQKAVNWNNGPSAYLNYAYDANGNVTSIASTNANGVDLSYAYGPLNRLTNVLDHGSPIAGYSYDLAGNLQALRYGNGVTNQYQYDSLNRLTNSTWNLSFNTLAKFSYMLGATGTRTNLNETVGGTNRLYIWQYDRLYRLTNENESSTISPFGNLAYQFDPVGNRTNRQSSISQLPSTSYSYNTNDWLTTDTYDAKGNTITSSGTNFQYDAMNRLTNAVINGSQILMTYDGDGNRVSKTVGGTTTYYLVDDVNPSGYSQVLQEYRGTALTNVYNFGLALISQRTPYLSTNYFISDGHGSTRMLTDIGGTVVNVMVYDAYGNLIASNGMLQTAYLYSGQQFDSDLGLYLNRARYLNTGTGRFWTMDGDYGNNEDPLSLHKYLYAEDGPVNGMDRSGHEDEVELSATMGIIGNLASRIAYVALRAMNTVEAIPGLSTTIVGGQTILTWWGISTDPSQAGLYVESGGLAADFAFLRAISSGFKNQIAVMYAGINDVKQAQGVAAILTKDTIIGGTKASQSIEPPGWNLLPAGNRARAHLLGKSLGGNGGLAENLVAMYQTANQRMYNQFEQKVLDAVEGGAKVEYAATPIYGGQPFPIAIHCYAKGDNGLDLDLTIKNEP